MSNIRFYDFIIITALTASCGPGHMPSDGITARTHVTPSGGAAGDATAETTFDLAKCGFDKSKPGVNFSSRRMSITPIPMTVTSAILGGIFSKTDNVVVTGLAILEDSMLRSVSTYSGNVTPVVDSEDVKPILSKLSSGFAADILEPSLREKLGESNEDWKGVFCSFQPAMKLERGALNRVTVDLDKPLPISPSAISNIVRLKSEIGTKRVWRGITAKVTSSIDSSVIVGTTWTGSATSEPVATTATIDGVAGKVTVQAEIAVKMTYDFGSADANKALGLPKSIIWYIDTVNKAYKLIQIDNGDGVPFSYLPSL